MQTEKKYLTRYVVVKKLVEKSQHKHMLTSTFIFPELHLSSKASASHLHLSDITHLNTEQLLFL